MTCIFYARTAFRPPSPPKKQTTSRFLAMLEIVDEERLLFSKFSEVNSSSLGTHCPRRHRVNRIWRDKNIPILPESAIIAEAANCCNLTLKQK